MRRALLGLLMAALLAPAGADAQQQAKRRCPAPSELTRYEDGFVQVFARKRNKKDSELLACRRGSTRRPFAVAFESDESTETVGAGVEQVLGGRYLWTSETYTYAESPDAEQHNLFDLETREGVALTTGGDAGPSDVVAVPGSLAATNGGPLTLNRIGGEQTEIDPGQTAAPAYADGTLYWQSSGGVRSQAIEGAGTPPRSRDGRRSAKRSRCLPRGRFTVLRDLGVVVNRTRAGRYFACRSKNGRQRALRLPGGAVASGPPVDLTVVDGDRRVYYRRPVTTDTGEATALAILDAKTGKLVRSAIVAGLKEAVPVTGGFVYTDGTTVTAVDAEGTREVGRGTAVTALAASESVLQNFRRVLYWTDGGQPRTVDLDAPAPG